MSALKKVFEFAIWDMY